MSEPATTVPVTAPISDVHEMMDELERQHGAQRINRIVNDPSIYPHVKGYATGPLDLSAGVANPANVCLLGEHGGVLFEQMAPAVFEAHTQVLPKGRGAWTVTMVQAALMWMFARTPAVEIFTRVPKGNDAALGLVRAVHGVRQFTRKRGWVVDLDEVPADIYALDVKEWMRRAPGLEERGRWFHARLEQEYARHGRTEPPHDDDPVHDRYVGAACEMILSGHAQKGVVLYNRWAVMAGYQPVQIMSLNPVTINIRDAVIIIRGDDFWVPSILKA